MRDSGISLWIIGVGVGIFLLLLLVIAWAANRSSQRNMEDYVLGRRNLGPIVGFFTVTTTLFSAFSYFGIIGWFYSDGIGAWAISSNAAVAGILVYFVGTRVWMLGRKYGFLNITEYLSDRYRCRAVGVLAGAVMVVAFVPYIGVQLRGSGLTLNAMTDGAIPFWIGAILLTCIIIVYVMIGGFRGIVWTDVAQGILMYGILIVAMFVMVYRAGGGFTNMMSQVQSSSPSLLSTPGPNGRFSPIYVASLIVFFGLANFTVPQMQQRWLALRSHRTLKLTAGSLAIGSMLLFIPGFYIAMAGKTAFPNVKNPQAIYPMMIGAYLPPVLAIVALIGILAATVTTANGVILTIGSIVGNEWWAPLVRRRRRPDQRELTRVTRGLLPVLVILGLGVAFFGPTSIVVLVTDITWPMVFMVFPTLIAGLYWKRVTSSGAIASIIVGVGFLLALTEGWIPVNLAGLAPAIPAAVIGGLVLVVISLLTRAPDRSHIARYFAMFERTKPVRGDRAVAETE